MDVRMYVCTDLCMYGFMHVWMYGCMDVRIYVCTDVCICGCMDVYMYIWMDVCIYVCTYRYVCIESDTSTHEFLHQCCLWGIVMSSASLFIVRCMLSALCNFCGLGSLVSWC